MTKLFAYSLLAALCFLSLYSSWELRQLRSELQESLATRQKHERLQELQAEQKEKQKDSTYTEEAPQGLLPDVDIFRKAIERRRSGLPVLFFNPIKIID